jgi:lipopolysaccharide export system permease protein
LEFQSGVSPETLDALLVRPEQMAAHQLWRYVDYLEAGKQKTSRYELALWKKMSYPIGVMAMLLLALPIAYVQTRSGYLGLKVFAGIGVGLAFHLLNNLFSHLTTLGDWPAAAVAITPSLIAMLLALSVLQMAQRRAL